MSRVRPTDRYIRLLQVLSACNCQCNGKNEASRGFPVFLGIVFVVLFFGMSEAVLLLFSVHGKSG